MNKLLKAMLIAIAISLAPHATLAATQADSSRTARGKNFTMCSAEQASGACQNSANTQDIYAIVDRYEQFTFFFTQVSSGTTCDIYATDKSASITSVTNLDDFTYLKINSTSLSATADKISIDGTFYYMWIECTVSGVSYPTITMQASEGLERQ